MKKEPGCGSFDPDDVGAPIEFSEPEQPRLWAIPLHLMLAKFNTYVSVHPRGHIEMAIFRSTRAMALRDLIRGGCHLLGLDPLVIAVEHVLFDLVTKHKDKLYKPASSASSMGTFRIDDIADAITTAIAARNKDESVGPN